MSEVYAWGQSETLLKGQGSHNLDFSLRGTKGLSEAYVHQEQKGSNPLTILFFYTSSYNYNNLNF